MDRSSEIDLAITNLATQRGTDKTICPSGVARQIGGQDELIWRALMKPIRERAVRMAMSGIICIKKGGDVVDPEDFTGIYRIAIVED